VRASAAINTEQEHVFLPLVDDLSRYMWISLMASKDQALVSFVTFRSQAEAESGRKVGTLRTDCGGGFTAWALIEHCMEERIHCHLTTPYTPEQNGVVEQQNQFVMGVARRMLKEMKMSGSFWGEALVTTVYVLSRWPT
jgi:transposase InsO family protein